MPKLITTTTAPEHDPVTLDAVLALCPTGATRRREIDTSDTLAAGDVLVDLPGQRLLVTRDLDDAQVWARAVAVRAGQVVLLPDGVQWLGERLSDTKESTNE